LSAIEHNDEAEVGTLQAEAGKLQAEAGDSAARARAAGTDRVRSETGSSDQAMGTTATGGEAGASITTDTDKRPGIGEEAAPATAARPGTPYDVLPGTEDPVHRAPGYSTGEMDR